MGLSPDDASAKAARGLTSIGKWPQLGANAQALWGECQGSGSKPYQTQVDLAGPAFKCTCPSRTQPGVKSFVIASTRSMGSSLLLSHRYNSKGFCQIRYCKQHISTHKQLFSSIKSGPSPINPCTSSYEIDSASANSHHTFNQAPDFLQVHVAYKLTRTGCAVCSPVQIFEVVT